MDNNKIYCQLICSSTSDHLEQVYSGFNMLNDAGKVNLIISKDDNFSPGYNTSAFLKVVVNGSLNVSYDTFDSANINGSVLDWSHYYF